LLAVFACELGFLMKEKFSKKSFLKEDAFLGHSCQISAAKSNKRPQELHEESKHLQLSFFN